MKHWYCEMCGTGPTQGKSRTANNLLLCHTCFFTHKASEALKEYTLKDPKTILASIPRKQQKDFVVLQQWLSACCERDPTSWTAREQLYTVYKNWCTANRYKPLNSLALERCLSDYGLIVGVHHL